MTSDQKRHLHPFALIYYVYRGIINWGIWAIILFSPVRAGLNHIHVNSMTFLIGFVIFVAGWVLLKFYYFTFQIGDDMVTINSGIIVKRHTHIPYSRIQTIQRSQWFFLKPLKLEMLRIETAGHENKRPEVVLPLVSETVREEIERKRLAKRSDSTNSTPSEIPASGEAKQTAPQYEINPHDLNIFAVTSFGVFPLIGVLGAIYGKIQDYIPQKFIDTVTKELVQQSLIIISVIVVLIVILAIIGSYLSIVQKYYRFTLHAQSGQLKIYQGLFQRKSVTIPVNRIQALRIKQNVLRQWAKLSTVQALAASSAGDEDKGNDMMVLPVIKNEQVFPHLATFIPWSPKQLVPLTRLPHANRYYFIRNAMFWSLIPILVCLFFFHLWGLLSLPLLLFSFSLGFYSAQNTGWQTIADQILLQNGHWFTRTQFLIPRKNVQSFILVQSIWMKRTHLAHLRVNVRHGNHNELVEIRYVPLAAAQNLFDWLES